MASALVIRHRLANGLEFLALYGHIRSNFNVGNAVTAGQVFATIGPYSPLHLHFGIHLSLTMPSSNWGLLPCSSWASTNKFIEPINWITQQDSTLPDVPFLNRQGQHDIMKRSISDNRFNFAIAGSFGANPGWDANWELRWMDFTFTPNRSVRLYHFTSRTNSSERYTLFWDPDSNTWSSLILMTGCLC